MNKAIKEFLEANPLKRRAMVRLGFELETQSTNEMTADDSEIDYNAAMEEINDHVNDVLGSMLEDHLSLDLMERVRDAVYDSISNDFDYSDYEIAAPKQILEQIDRARYMFERSNRHIYKDALDSASGAIQVGKDGSVDGFEIRTVGPLRYVQAISAMVGAFDPTHEIDTGCSFHIHLSLPGVKHHYGQRMQIAMTEFLIENQSRLPESVKERFRGAPENQYIEGLIGSRKKYSFIYCHPQGTWEFRCFGNVQNKAEGVICMNLAIEALAYAYSAVYCGKKLLVDGIETDVEHLFRQCLTFNRSISESIRRMRKVA